MSSLVLGLVGLAIAVVLIVRARREGTWTGGDQPLRMVLLISAVGFASATVAEVLR